jgi:predicted metalloprotease
MFLEWTDVAERNALDALHRIGDARLAQHYRYVAARIFTHGTLITSAS